MARTSVRLRRALICSSGHSKHYDPIAKNSCRKTSLLLTSVSCNAKERLLGRLRRFFNATCPSSPNGSAASKKCPTGSSTLCAQAVAVSALGPPVDEACAPIAESRPIPRVIASEPWWKTKAVGYKVPACSCGAPTGSLCTGHFRIFEDDACGKLISDNPIASIGDQCSNVLPPGKAIGSKEITDLTYIPGVCAPMGGEPIGDVQPDPTHALTFCCLSSDA